jgi:phage terminase large subunit
MFQRTTAINKLLKMRARKRVVQGGTSAGKTFGILPILINHALCHPNSEISVVSESIPHLRRGALKDFIKVMVWTKRWKDSSFNKSLLTYRFGNGSYIEFFSADQPDKLRGARRQVLYINECNNVDFESYQQLAIRTSEVIWLDYNPSSEFWVHTEVLNEPDSELIILNYKDNEALPKTIVKEIENNRDKAIQEESNGVHGYWWNWWQVYGLGLIGSLQGVVFNNWKPCDYIPDGAKLLGYGLDFGYSNDPTAMVAVYQYDRAFYYDEVIYQKGLLNSELAALIKQHPSAIIYADSAEPKTINDLKSYGIRITETTKGRDSIMNGIAKMQEGTFYVTKKSLNLIKELRSYIWKTDRSGKSLNEPIDAFNHGIDAIRYYQLANGKYSGKYIVL